MTHGSVSLPRRSYLRRIDRRRRDDYRVVLVYLSLGSLEGAVPRLAERVRQGATRCLKGIGSALDADG